MALISLVADIIIIIMYLLIVDRTQPHKKLGYIYTSYAIIQ